MDSDLKDISPKITIWWLNTHRLKSYMLSNCILDNVGLMAYITQCILTVENTTRFAPLPHPNIRNCFVANKAKLSENSSHMVSPSGSRALQSVECLDNDAGPALILGQQ
jgi:hypothetical protein